MKTKGLSDVVVTVMLVTITLVAVVLLAKFLIPFIKQKLYSGSECLPYDRDYFQFEESFYEGGTTVNYNCHILDAASYRVGVSVKNPAKDQKLQEKVSGFILVLSSTTESKSFYVNGSTLDTTTFRSLGASLTSPEPILPPNISEVNTYFYNELPPPSSPRYTKSAIYPVLKSGRICGQNAEIMLNPCIGAELS
jgi:hypothetical protein